MKLTLSQGLAHAEPRIATAATHTIRVRLGAGFGDEAFDSQDLKPSAWPSGAMEYMPPGLAHAHATHIGTDWLTLELNAREWTQATENTAIPDRPVRCDAGLIHEDACAWTRAAYVNTTALHSSPEDARALGAEIAAVFLAALGKRHGKPQTRALSRTALHRLAIHIESNLDTDVGQMAEVAGFSRFYFISAFRQASGSTPHQYLIGRRLGKARQLLRKTTWPVTEIALECGFSSHAHLTAAFSRHFGMAPTAYRVRMSGKSSIALA